MAGIPNIIAIKPFICPTYACYERGTESGHVFCNERSVFNPFTKIELEQARQNANYYNLRFCHSNRYWAKSQDDNRIVAVSKQPDEEIARPSCTLFEARIVSRGVLRLTHVQSGNSVRKDSASTRLCLDRNFDGRDTFNFNFVDWETLVKLPRHLAFMEVDNGRYLKAVTHNNLPCLEFTSTDANDGFSAQDVIQQGGTYIQIKSVNHGNFWRRGNDNWILADSTDDSGSDRDTLFWSRKVADNRITLYNVGNGESCGWVRVEGMTDSLLATTGDHPIFEVVALAPESYVHNVRFQTEDERVFDEQSYVVDTKPATNVTDTESLRIVRFEYDVTNSFSFTHSYSLRIDAQTTFNTDVPSNPKVEGNVTPVHFVRILSWGETVTETRTRVVEHIVTVPARSQIQVARRGNRVKWSVPFKYTQRDTYPSGGGSDTNDYNDGIFYGKSEYGFTFEEFPPEPIRG